MTNKQVLNEFQTRMKSLLSNCPYKGWEMKVNLVNGRMVVSINDAYTDKSIVKGIKCCELDDSSKIKNFISIFAKDISDAHKFYVKIDGKQKELQKVFKKQIKAGNMFYDLDIETCLKITDALSDASIIAANNNLSEVSIGELTLSSLAFGFSKNLFFDS